MRGLCLRMHAMSLGPYTLTDVILEHIVPIDMNGTTCMGMQGTPVHPSEGKNGPAWGTGVKEAQKEIYVPVPLLLPAASPPLYCSS